MYRGLCNIVCVLSLIFPAAVLRADSVYLVDGRRIENVRVLFEGGRINLIKEDGNIAVLREDQVLSIINATVTWEGQLSEEDFQRRAQAAIADRHEEIRKRERERIDEEENFKRVMFGRSLRVPGWGQFSSDRSWSGFVFSGLTAVMLWRTGAAIGRIQRARAQYDDVQTPLLLTVFGAAFGGGPSAGLVLEYRYFEDRKAALQGATADTREGLISVFFLWIVGMADAYFFSALPPADDDADGDFFPPAAEQSQRVFRIYPEHVSGGGEGNQRLMLNSRAVDLRGEISWRWRL